MHSESYMQEMQTFSLLSNKPIIFDGNKCFWKGMFMHKQMALAICSTMFAKVQHPKSCLINLWELQWDVVQDAKIKFNWKPTFKLYDFKDQDLFRFLYRKIHDFKIENEEGFCFDWQQNPQEMFWYFLKNQ